MKINKYISLDEDIVHQLQREINASDVVNQQLRAYYDVKSCESVEILKQKLIKIKQILKENRKKEKELIQKITKITQKNKEFLLNIQDRFPKELINQLLKIENLDYDAALILVRKFDLQDKGIGGVKLIKFWEDLKNR